MEPDENARYLTEHLARIERRMAEAHEVKTSRMAQWPPLLLLLSGMVVGAGLFAAGALLVVLAR